MRGAPNTIIFLIFRQYYWRTDAPCANRSGGPNMKKKIIGALCLVSIVYWRTDTPCANSISARKPPAPILMADQTQKMDKDVRILNRQGGEIIRCANNMFIYIL